MDWDGNLLHILRAIDEARALEASLLCLPELCISGYGCEDAFLSTGVAQMSEQVLREILPATAGMVVSLGLPVLHRGGVFNMAALAVDQKLAALIGKQNLAGDGLHYEPRWFKPWPNDVRVTTELAGQQCPMGDLLVDVDDVRIGFEICEDAWVADRPGADLAQQSVDLIFNPSASHFAFGKHEVRERFVLNGARALHVCYIYANLLGNEAGRAIYDGDVMIANCGSMIAVGPRFSFDDVQLTAAAVDVDRMRISRARMGSYHPEMVDQAGGVTSVPFHIPEASPRDSQDSRADWESSSTLKEEEFTRAVSLGLFDYLRKSRSHGFVVSLSGGADSSAVAVLCSRMVCFGLEELGAKRFGEKLSHIETTDGCQTPADWTRRLLTCVYQSTQHSGLVTRAAANGVAHSIHAEYLELDVDDLVQGYINMIEQAVQRQLQWSRDDLALQNIQARARGPGVWLLANLRGALLLATSNRSEAAVGYATMDGDTCGGLSPIAGIDKAFLRQWLRWMETVGPLGAEPVPALAAVNVQEPTAELRPAEQGQTDEADLMPYELLDAVERAAIRDKRTPLEVFQLMEVQFAQYERRQLANWVERFFRLWCRNQWKRERYAPSFHVDDENLDPKTWCRFPILSGGFSRELNELRQHVDSDTPNAARRQH